MRVYRWLVAMALALAFTGVAYADSLYTAPMVEPTKDGLKIACLIVNVGNQTRTVTILLNGVKPGTTTDLAPGNSMAVVDSGPWCTDGGCGHPPYCVFTVQGSKNSFRAAICMEDSSESPLACLPAK